MNTILILRLANTFLALASLPPGFFLMKHLITEYKEVASGVRLVNKVLINSFILFSLAGMANAILSLLLLLDFNFLSFLREDHAQAIFNIRNLLVNFGYFVVSWGLWYAIFIRSQGVKK